ncbi:hypothetical protein ACU686_26800 [Yinghuangia aomiensis]
MPKSYAARSASPGRGCGLGAVGQVEVDREDRGREVALLAAFGVVDLPLEVVRFALVDLGVQGVQAPVQGFGGVAGGVEFAGLGNQAQESFGVAALLGGVAGELQELPVRLGFGDALVLLDAEGVREHLPVAGCGVLVDDVGPHRRDAPEVVGGFQFLAQEPGGGLLVLGAREHAGEEREPVHPLDRFHALVVDDPRAAAEALRRGS